MADPVGIRRPDPAALLELDDYAVICTDLRQFIRGRFAAAHDRVSVWQLPPLPEMRQRPAPTSASGRGTTR